MAIDPQLQQELSDALTQAAIAPAQVQGRSFVVSREVIDAIVSRIDPQSTVIELAAGTGVVAKALAERGQTVYALEPNESLAKLIEQQCAGFPTIKVAKQGSGKDLHNQIREIVLHISNTNPAKDKKAAPRYTVVAVFPTEDPYDMMQPVLDQHFRPENVILGISETAAKPFQPHASNFTTLSHYVHYFGKPEIFRVLTADDFLPPLKEPMSLLTINTAHLSRFIVGNRPLLFKMIEASLVHQRTLPDSMSMALHVPTSMVRIILRNCSINPSRRANTLTLDDWRKFYQEYETYRTTENYTDQTEVKEYNPWLEEEK